MSGFRYNALLILCAEGHVEVELEGAGLRREAYLSVPGIRTKAEAKELGKQMLELSQEEVSTLAVSGRALGNKHIPGTAFNLLDKMAGDPVMSYGVTMEDEGYANVVPEIGEALDHKLEALARKIERANAGIMPEHGALPPLPTTQTGTGSGAPSPWSHDGEIEIMTGVDSNDPAMPEKGASPPWLVRSTYHVSWLEATLTKAGSGPTRIQAILQNPVIGDPGRFVFASVLGEVTVPANRFTAVKLIDITVTEGRRVVLVCPAAGDGAEGLTARIVGAQVGGSK